MATIRNIVKILISHIVFYFSISVKGFGFDESQVYNSIGSLQNSLDVAHLNSMKIQHSYQLGFYGNETHIKFEPLGFDLASAIMSLKPIYYQIWTSFDDGAYLGYYQKEPFSSKYNEFRHGISFSFNENHSCPQYNYTSFDWLNSGLGDDPGNSTNPITKNCQEHFLMSDKNGQFDGPGAESVGGQIYDARIHDWYNDVKNTNSKQWVDYVDSLVDEPALAICYPLNNRTDDGLLDGLNVLGVACTGMMISELCEKLDYTIDAAKSFAYIRDRVDGSLVAASVNSTKYVFNYEKLDRYSANESIVDLISWSSKAIGVTPFDESISYLLHDTTGEVNYHSYFTSVTPFREGTTLNWDLIILQRVDCPIGYEVAPDNETCTKCVSPLTSFGGNTGCDACVPNYYKRKAWSHCKLCPVGATCAGGLELPVSQAGYWGDDKGIDGQYLSTMYQCQTISGQSCLANFTCLNGFAGRQCGEPETGYMFLGSYSLKCGYVGAVYTGDGWQAFVVYLFLLMFMIVANYSVYYYDSFDILVNSMQNIALIYEIQFNWPQNSSIVVMTIAQWVLLGLDAVYPTCLGQWSFYSNIILQLVLPVVVVPLLIGLLSVFKLVKKSRCQKLIGFGFLFLDLSYTGLVLNSFQVFACQPATNGNSYLYASPTEQCYTPEHNAMRWIAFFILSIIGIGYPCAIYFLTKNVISKKVSLKKKHFHVWGFAFDTFKFRFNHWSFVQLSRNFITCAVAALMVTDPGQQGALYLMITVLNIVVMMKFNPLISKESANLEINMGLLEVGVIVIGFLFGIEYVPNLIVLEVCLVMLLSIYPILMIVVVFNEIFDHNVSEGTRNRMISFQRKISKTLTKSHSPRRSELAQSSVSFDDSESPYHKQVALFKDCILGAWSPRYRKGKPGHEDEDALSAFVKSFSAKDLNSWAHDKVDPPSLFDLNFANRNGLHIEHCRAIGAALTPLLERTHFVSNYSSDVFWSDIASNSPIYIDYILESLRTSTPQAGGGTVNFQEKQKSLHSFFLYLRELKYRKQTTTMLSDLIDESALAPILYFCITTACQDEIDMLFILLTEMNEFRNDGDEEILQELHLCKGLGGQELGKVDGLTLKNSVHLMIHKQHYNTPGTQLPGEEIIGTLNDPEMEFLTDLDSIETDGVDIDDNPLQAQIELVAQINAKRASEKQKSGVQGNDSFTDDVTSQPTSEQLLDVFK